MKVGSTLILLFLFHLSLDTHAQILKDLGKSAKNLASKENREKVVNSVMDDMEKGDLQALRGRVVVSSDIDEGKLREPTEKELKNLLSQPFERGRIVDQRPHEGKTRDFYYLVYREPDGRIYALIATEFNGRFRIVIPEIPLTSRNRYLWDYQWTN